MYAYKTDPTRPSGRDNKVLGAGSYTMDWEGLNISNICYTGIWKDGQIVALAVANNREPAAEDIGTGQLVQQRCAEITHKLNGYGILLECFNASHAFVNAMGVGNEDEAIEVAVQREREAEARFEKATLAVREMLRGAP